MTQKQWETIYNHGIGKWPIVVCVFYGVIMGMLTWWKQTTPIAVVLFALFVIWTWLSHKAIYKHYHYD